MMRFINLDYVLSSSFKLSILPELNFILFLAAKTHSNLEAPLETNQVVLIRTFLFIEIYFMLIININGAFHANTNQLPLSSPDCLCCCGLKPFFLFLNGFDELIMPFSSA